MCEYVDALRPFPRYNFTFSVMWNSYAFVHYASMDEGRSSLGRKAVLDVRFPFLARRALDQSNGAMFLNRKLIVQLSTSRFRPQPKEAGNPLAQTPKQLMVMTSPSSPSALAYHHLTNGSSTNGGGSSSTQQQPNTLTQQYQNGKYIRCIALSINRSLFCCRNQL